VRLGLGTAQFGMAYGIANRTGQIGDDEAGQILDLARQSEISLVDTAISYGDSESSLGNLGCEDFKIVTKLPDIPNNVSDPECWIEAELNASLARLKVESIYALLLHRPKSLTSESSKLLIRGLEDQKARGRVSKLGVSVYSPGDLELIPSAFNIDIVQAPLNLVDRRFVTSGWMDRLDKAGVEIHTRSAFLQGLLLMKREEIPEQFERWATIWNSWHSALANDSTSATTASLHFLLQYPQIDQIIVGVDSVDQLRQLIEVSRRPVTPQCLSDMASSDEDLVDPSTWIKP